MTTACYAEGMTVIQNAAMEPEVTALAEFLNSLGARVEGAGTSTVTVIGPTTSKAPNFEFRPTACRPALTCSPAPSPAVT